MATVRLQIFYQVGEGAKWSNVYHIDAPDLPGALVQFTDFMKDPLLGLLHSTARITKVLASSLLDDTFSELSVEEAGTSAFTDSALPFFDCVKLLIATAGLGRPDVKFLKGWLTEGNSSSGSIDSTPLGDVLTDFQGMIDSLATEGTPLVSENGDEWATASAPPLIQMRQMHRKRRRVVP